MRTGIALLAIDTSRRLPTCTCTCTLSTCFWTRILLGPATPRNRPQELSLRCQLHPAVVPLLARLPRLRELHLTLTRGHGTDTWSSSGTAVAAALLPLVLGAPRVQRLQLAAHRDSGHKLLAALREGVEWVQGQLRGMGRDPAVVSVLISNFVG